MEISFVKNSKALQQKTAQDYPAAAKSADTETSKQYAIKNKMDSAQLSGSAGSTFDDKKLAMAKSALLYDVSVNTSAVNASRVEDLRKAVADGTYHVPSGLIADSILGE